MKKYLLISALLIITAGANAQTVNHKLGITSGYFIQQYNGNLGNSFFKFNTVCFDGGAVSFGYYLNKTFDFNLSTSVGDFGYSQTAADANRIVAIADRCPGCVGRTGMGELRSRMVSGNIAVKFKFANGVILKEDSKVSPYVYFGCGNNHLTDNMHRDCVNVGNHFSLNSGAGVKYNLNERFNIGYSLGLGYFTSDKVYATNNTSDAVQMQGKKDMYMQNTLFIGINLF
jgi:hypothetical protein